MFIFCQDEERNPNETIATKVSDKEFGLLKNAGFVLNCFMRKNEEETVLLKTIVIQQQKIAERRMFQVT